MLMTVLFNTVAKAQSSAELICNSYYDHKAEANLKMANLVYFNPFPAFSPLSIFFRRKALIR